MYFSGKNDYVIFDIYFFIATEDQFFHRTFAPSPAIRINSLNGWSARFLKFWKFACQNLNPNLFVIWQYFIAVDGGFTEWSQWSLCDNPCGGSVVNRTRTCANPTPSLDGKPCTGATVQTKMECVGPCPSRSNLNRVHVYG